MLAPRAQSTISSTSSHCRAIRNRIQKRRHWTTARYSQFSCLSFCHTSSRRGQRELSPEVCLAIQDPCQRCMRPPCCLSVSVTVSWKHRDKSHRAHVDFVPRSLFCLLKDQEQQRKKKRKCLCFPPEGKECFGPSLWPTSQHNKRTCMLETTPLVFSPTTAHHAKLFSSQT